MFCCNPGIVSAMPHIGSGTNEGRDAMLMFAFDNAYQVLVQGIPPQSPINGFMTPQGFVQKHFFNFFLKD